MALRWFVGLNIDQDAWDASTFSQNRRRRFDKASILETLFDQTLKRAFEQGLVSRHVSADGTLVRANASYKSFVPIEVALDPEEYKERLRQQDEEGPEGPQDAGNHAVDFRGEKRSNSTHRSMTDPDCRFVSKGRRGPGRIPATRSMPSWRIATVSSSGWEWKSSRARFRNGWAASTCCVEPAAGSASGLRVSVATRGSSSASSSRGCCRKASNRTLQRRIEAALRPIAACANVAGARPIGCRNAAERKIEELFGEGKDWHGLRRFRRRGLPRVREEAKLIGWVLNLKRLAKLLTPRVSTA